MTDKLDRWLALICGVVWLGIGAAFALGWIDPSPWYVAFICCLGALHRINGCTSFMGREG